MRLFFVLLSLAVCVVAEPVRASETFAMEPYKAACNERSRIYASCADQRKILNEGLLAAQRHDKLAAVIFGFNDCPPCKAMDLWMHTEAAKAAFAPYQIIEISIFDPERHLRPEVFSSIIPQLKMPIDNAPPYGVPSFAIVDPATRQVVGKPITGFDSEDQSAHVAYLRAYSKH